MSPQPIGLPFSAKVSSCRQRNHSSASDTLAAVATAGADEDSSSTHSWRTPFPCVGSRLARVPAQWCRLSLAVLSRLRIVANRACDSCRDSAIVTTCKRTPEMQGSHHGVSRSFTHCGRCCKIASLHTQGALLRGAIWWSHRVSVPGARVYMKFKLSYAAKLLMRTGQPAQNE